MNEKMHNVVREMDQLEMEKLHQIGSDINNMKGKGKEMEYNKG